MNTVHYRISGVVLLLAYTPSFALLALVGAHVLSGDWGWSEVWRLGRYAFVSASAVGVALLLLIAGSASLKARTNVALVLFLVLNWCPHLFSVMIIFLRWELSPGAWIH